MPDNNGETTAKVQKSPADTLISVGIEPLLDSATVCTAEGVVRETLSRRVSRGEYPPPDQIINGRNYWYQIGRAHV